MDLDNVMNYLWHCSIGTLDCIIIAEIYIFVSIANSRKPTLIYLSKLALRPYYFVILTPMISFKGMGVFVSKK